MDPLRFLFFANYNTSQLSVSRLTVPCLSGHSSAQKIIIIHPDMKILISFLPGHNRSNCMKNITKLPIKITNTCSPLHMPDCSIFAYHDINQGKKMTKLPIVHVQLPRCSVWNEMVSLVWTGFYNLYFSFEFADQKTVTFHVGLKLTAFPYLSVPVHKNRMPTAAGLSRKDYTTAVLFLLMRLNFCWKIVCFLSNQNFYLTGRTVYHIFI